ncbi:tetratricopeptide repeat (TPR)-like superfamily protein isoform X2 [Tasmannia lanceolata]|uniref:tetratricopeptide repeat (TPR)-like superfamily protein isoform X2 n=1 Tax=Tasmannia lanceolata TaxID=3420 RepID=UPI00406387F5
MREQLGLMASSILVPPKPYSHHPFGSKPYSTKPSNNSSSKPFPRRSPLLTEIRLNPTPAHHSHLKYYAHLVSKLVETGKFNDFLMIAESVLVSGAHSSMDIELILVGISDLLRNGKIQTLIGILDKLEKLGFRPLSMFDGSTRALLALECPRLVKNGRLEELVGLMEVLAGYGFCIRDFVEPFDILKMCVKRGDPNMAVRYASILPHAHNLYSSIIHQFGQKHDLESALVAFEASKSKSDGPNMYIYRSIIDTCGLCGDYLRSRCIFEELLAQKFIPNTYVFNSLMNVNAHDLSYTLHVYKQMQACCFAGRVDLALDIYKEVKDMASAGVLKLDVITYSTIIKVFADAKMWQMALNVKEDMTSSGVIPNIITWSSLIRAFSNPGLVEQAIQVFEEMIKAGCEPNSQCCNILLYACVESYQYDRAFRFFNSWMKNGFQMTCTEESSTKVVPLRPTVATFNILMKACGTDYCHAKDVMDEMRVAGLSPNHISWSILIDICGRSRDIKGAMQAFKTMRDAGINPDVVAYTTVIKACVENKNLKIAFSLFEEMKRYQIRPNLVTYNTLLRARSRYGSLREVQQCLAIYLDMRNAGYSSNDYFLRELLAEWCEGVIKDSDQNQGLLRPRNSCEVTDAQKPQSLLLEKIAMYLQKDTAKSLAVNLRGLTKVEARIVVLAVLRMIKENYTLGHPIKGDLIIISGVIRKEGLHAADNEFEVQGAVIKVLQDELGLEVLAGPGIALGRNNPQSPSDSNPTSESLRKNDFPMGVEFSARRPSDLGRLMVTRKSLYQWLEKRVGPKR